MACKISGCDRSQTLPTTAKKKAQTQRTKARQMRAQLEKKLLKTPKTNQISTFNVNEESR
jgi:hypothetical protein